MNRKKDVLIIGAGPAGYAAAIRLGQLGRQAILIEEVRPGGICLNKGCIPTKALFSAINMIAQAQQASQFGLEFDLAGMDTGKLNSWKNRIVRQVREGVSFLLAEYGVEVVSGKAKFIEDKVIEVKDNNGRSRFMEADNVIIAVGSQPKSIPGVAFNRNTILSPEQALDVSCLPSEVAVIGGGIIGVELANIFQNLGCIAHIIEKEKEVLIDFDKDVRSIVRSSLHRIGVEVLTNTNVVGIVDKKEGLELTLNMVNQSRDLVVQKMIIAIGRSPRTGDLNLRQIGVTLNSEQFVIVNDKGETNITGLYAAGDVCGRPLAAHKAYRQGLAVADAIAGLDCRVPKFIPSVAFSAIEGARVGLTEEAARKICKVRIGYFPFTASGRAITSEKTKGFVKVVSDRQTSKILGIHMAGSCVSELVSEATLALEAGMNVKDFSDIVRPHPTMSEALTEASLDVYSQAIHFMRPTKGSRRE
jgi:dihydrolipoamide dehydrogenase